MSKTAQKAPEPLRLGIHLLIECCMPWKVPVREEVSGCSICSS